MPISGRSCRGLQTTSSLNSSSFRSYLNEAQSVASGKFAGVADSVSRDT